MTKLKLVKSAHFPPEEAEGLIETFQKRFFDARLQLRQFEVELKKMEYSGTSPEETRELKLKMEALANRQKAWLKSLSKTLNDYETLRGQTLNPNTRRKKK